MERICAITGRKFEITLEDLEFYKKMNVLPPTLCPEERSRRRMAYRNERHLYKNIDCVTGKEIISTFAPDSSYHNCEIGVWYSDKVDNFKHGRDFDFSRPFFDQFNDLLHDVTLPALATVNTVNSDYANYVDGAKNCYLFFASDNCEDCYYVSYIWECKNCVDCYGLLKSELCYECVDCRNCYKTIFSQFCMQCSDCTFCFDCKSCDNCFGSSGLRHKKYVYFNEQLSKEDYMARMKEIYPLTDKKIKEFGKQTIKLSLQIPRKYAQISKCESSTGDFLTNCKNCIECYDCYEDENCKWVMNGPKNNKFCYDCTGVNTGELAYECVISATGSYDLAFGVLCWLNDFHLRYCYYCIGSKNLFGCAGIKRGEYAIFNKKYSKEEYEKLVPKIIEHMKKTKEWGEFFPIKYSIYPYNDTIAQEYFPLTGAEALTKGYKWHEEIPQELNKSPDVKICAECNKQYKFIPQELNFYKMLNLPIPILCHNCRYKLRFAKRNPKQLWERNCAECSAKILTTYAPERPEIVYCDKCYTKMLY